MVGSWDELKLETSGKSWKTIVENGATGESETDDDGDNVPLCNLIAHLPEGKETDVTEWMKNNEQFELIVESILEMLNESTAEGEGVI